MLVLVGMFFIVVVVDGSAIIDVRFVASCTVVRTVVGTLRVLLEGMFVELSVSAKIIETDIEIIDNCIGFFRMIKNQHLRGTKISNYGNIRENLIFGFKHLKKIITHNNRPCTSK